MTLIKGLLSFINNMDTVTIGLLIYSIAVTVIFAAVIIIKKKHHENSFYEYQNKVMSVWMEEMNNIYTTMRGWRHDYHNHMQTVKAHLALGELREAEAYINQMETELKSIDVKYKSGNLGVDAILNGKLSLAEKSGIRIKCDAALPKELGISQLDLCVALGNLIDNAIEACDKVKDGKGKFLRIYMCVMKRQLYISVSNGTNEVIRKPDKEYITGKRGNHGHGLKRINDIVKKHGGYINLQNEPGVFATEIMLPLA